MFEELGRVDSLSDIFSLDSKKEFENRDSILSTPTKEAPGKEVSLVIPDPPRVRSGGFATLSRFNDLRDRYTEELYRDLSEIADYNATNK